MWGFLYIIILWLLKYTCSFYYWLLNVVVVIFAAKIGSVKWYDRHGWYCKKKKGGVILQVWKQTNLRTDLINSLHPFCKLKAQQYNTSIWWGVFWVLCPVTLIIMVSAHLETSWRSGSHYTSWRHAPSDSWVFHCIQLLKGLHHQSMLPLRASSCLHMDLGWETSHLQAMVPHW